jgi:outer membrane PBP1 activator LpoA protein
MLIGCQTAGPQRDGRYQSYWDMPRTKVTKIRDFLANNLNFEWAQTHIANDKLNSAERAYASHQLKESQAHLSTIDPTQLNQYFLIRYHLLSAEIAASQGQRRQAAIEVSKISPQILSPDQQARYQRLLTFLHYPKRLQGKTMVINHANKQFNTSTLPAKLMTHSPRQKSSVSRLVLVLPLQGKNNDQALALRDGFLTGYWEAKSQMNRNLIIQVADRQTMSVERMQQLAKQPGILVLAPQINPSLSPARAFEQGRQTFANLG